MVTSRHFKITLILALIFTASAYPGQAQLVPQAPAGNVRAWLGRRSVRRLRRQDFELFADYGGLELHGEILSPARRGPGWHMEIPRSASRELTSTAGSADCPDLDVTRRALPFSAKRRRKAHASQA